MRQQTSLEGAGPFQGNRNKKDWVTPVTRLVLNRQNTRHRHLASVLEARQVLQDLENIL